MSTLISTNFPASAASGDVGDVKVIRHAPPGVTRIERRSTQPGHTTAAGMWHTAAVAGWCHVMIPISCAEQRQLRAVVQVDDLRFANGGKRHGIASLS